MRFGEAREPLGEEESRALRLRAGEAADRDSQLDGPADTGQVGQPTGIAAVDVAGLGTAKRASDHRRGDRQLDGQVVHVQGAINEAALWGSREEFEGDQEEDPRVHVEVASHGHEILTMRSPIIKSAGERLFRAHFQQSV